MGFEPTVPRGITGFQDQLLKPLGHLSELRSSRLDQTILTRKYPLVKIKSCRIIKRRENFDAFEKCPAVLDLNVFLINLVQTVENQSGIDSNFMVAIRNDNSG